jgi:hypothetical protein
MKCSASGPENPHREESAFMDPLNLLRELYGEEPIRKILNSGFDSPGKIAAATAESLSFFAGVQEALARQIIESAEAALTQPGESGERRESPAPSGRAIQPRELPRAAAGAGTATATATAKKHESSKSRHHKVELLDERPILDVGGLLKNLAKEPNPKQLLSDSDFLEEVGLTDAEAGFLEGISPWSTPAGKERVSPAAPGSQITFEPPVARSEPLEFAPISSWSPELDPDPVPRLVRAAELGPDPDAVTPAVELREPAPEDKAEAFFKTEVIEEPFIRREATFRTEVIEEGSVWTPTTTSPVEAARSSSKTAEPVGRPAQSHPPSALSQPSFWKFGK